ncbi:MAG: hemolysin family protein, partial [Gammaproteobacteria bacterium]
MLTFAAAVSVALVFSFLCSVFESVLLSLNHAQVESLAQQGKRSGALLRDFKRRIDLPISAILIVNTIAHTIGASVAGATYENVFDPQTLWIFTIVFTLSVLLFTEIIPKTLGVTYATSLAGPVAYGIHAFTFVLRPLVLLSEKISRALRGNKEVPVTSVEEIRLLATLGRNEGVVGVRTAGMIIGATRLRQLRAADVLVNRNLVVFLSATATRTEVLETLHSSGHSRFPFSPTKDLDQARSVVLAKDLLFWLQAHPDENIDWPELVRDLLTVPSGQPLDRLLRTYQESRSHMAIVVDEYGAVQGIVTMEDVMEEIVGDIVDESDRPREDIWPQTDGSLHARAAVELHRLSDHVAFDEKPTDTVASLGGLVNELLGHLPRQGDTVEWGGYRLEVLAANDRRAELIAVKRIAEA